MKRKMKERIMAVLLTTAMAFSVIVGNSLSVSAEEMSEHDLMQKSTSTDLETDNDEQSKEDPGNGGGVPGGPDGSEGTGGPDSSEGSGDSGDADEEILDGWVKKDEGWYYYKKGVMLTGWQVVGGTWYYMDDSGLMAEDTWIGDFYVDKSGAWIKSYQPAKWILSGGGWWYRNVDGSYPASSWKKIDEKWYYFNSAGYMVTGWTVIGGNWYYLSGDGSMLTGWAAIGGAWYYLNESGAMLTGWLSENGTWYYLNGSGAMQTGWLKLGSAWYYLEPNGAMAIGRKEVAKQIYFLNDSGAMVTGWNIEKDGWYYYNASGAMQKGWVLVGSKWFYCDPKTGTMYESHWLDNKYYLQSDGSMAVGWFKLGENWYYSDASGLKQTSKWIGDYYVQADGTMAVSKWIGEYYVGEDGKWVRLNSGEKVYTIDLGGGKQTTIIGYFDTKMADEVFKLLNDYRVQKGLNVLQPADPGLEAAVKIRGSEIAYSFEHTRPNGDSCFSVYDDAIAENIASGTSLTAAGAMEGWKNSVGHNTNMLLEGANSVGIAVFKARSGNQYINYFVQLFAL